LDVILNRDFMDLQVVWKYQDIDIYEVGWIQKSLEGKPLGKWPLRRLRMMGV